MKNGFWKSDWFVGLLITLVFAVFANSDLIQGVERSAYDFGVRSTSRTPSNKVAVIAIDDQSIANIGRWPWSRDVHAKMHDILTKGGAKAIGQTVFFLEPQIDPGLQYIRDLKNSFADSTMAAAPDLIDALDKSIVSEEKLLRRDAHGRAAMKKIRDKLETSPLKTRLGDELLSFNQFLDSAEIALDTDKTLADSMRKDKNVILAMPFIPGEPLGHPDSPLPEYVLKNRLPRANVIPSPEGDSTPITVSQAIPPIAPLGEEAIGIGSLVALPDVDGGIRTEPLVVDYYGDYYPSVALLLAARSLNLPLNDIKVYLGSRIQLGNLTIKTDNSSLMHTFFYSSDVGSAFPVDSFYDVLSGKIPASKYKGKIVLIGSTAYGIGDSMVTPINPAMPPVLTLAHSVSSILNEDFFITPDWAPYAHYGAIFLIALYLMLLLPRMSAGVGFIVSAQLFIVLFVTHYVLMTTQGMWIQLMLPTMLLVVGHLLLTTKRFLLTERGKAQLDIESAESNRMLGLSLQGQGQLDMAFEKFRKLPADKGALELLYNLALDYERKRQFNKAKSVYGYMLERDPKFRDIKERSTRAKAMEETVMLGGGKSSPGGTLIIEGGGVEKPMLGRYEIERELGKGAMGAVYLGRDPKISRVVAIKTMALSQEFEADELDEVKERFFREAETAGRLTHPSIVTIYDAGDEHDLAYIAMEFLKGTDLTKHIKKGNLLPLSKVITLIKRAAEGLDYAHSQNVVHRDIKPANIMYDEASDALKITDFGIARITDSSKTKTGMVLGTPSYMSPEQLAGKKVSGQSDLFSLGVMLFQMVTGELPFKGESMATLMYKIANEPHPAPESINTSLPRCITVIINRAMEKDTEKRYQRGAEMADDIAKCLKILQAEGLG
jgi:eukaryotic-like serine/threonine-protein kinase